MSHTPRQVYPRQYGPGISTRIGRGLSSLIRFRKNAALVSLLLVLSVVLVGCGSQPAPKGEVKSANNEQSVDVEQTKEKFKVGFIYNGPVGDAGYVYAHEMGRQYLVKQIPEVEAIYVENVPETADSERVMTQLVQEGCKVIFAISFGYMDYVQNVAQKFPDVVFLHCSGYKTAKNVGTYFGKIEQPRYLTGLIAGKMTKTGQIGYVAAHPIPECIRGINFFTKGIREVNPNATVKVVWTNTWYDHASEKETAKGLLDGGVDVIAQHQNTPGPQQAAQEKGVYGIGYNNDMSIFAPDANLTSPIWNWGAYYVQTVKSVMDGTWESSQYWGGMDEGVVGIAPISDLVPTDVKQLLEEKKQAIIDGSLNVFAGPIKDQNGKVKVPEGTVMSDEDVLNMNWFIEGVEGEIPQ